MPSLATRQPAPQPVEDLMSRLPANFPEMPGEIFDRFPSLAEWQEDTNSWWTRTYQALQSNQATVSQQATAGKTADDSLRVSIREERIERETADGFLEGKYTLTVTAGDVVTGMEITSSTGPNAGTVSEVAFQADKFQIYSGTTKKVMFVADAVQDKVRIAGVFTVDGTSSSIYIKTTAGAGSYNNSNTPFFVDNNGRMSLKDKLTWDGTTLTIGNSYIDSSGAIVLGTANDVLILTAADATYRIWIGDATAGSAAFRVTKTGAVTATSGTIGGWTLSSTTLSANNAVLDSSGNLALGTSNDIVILSATDATYRMWIGNVTAGSASFSVTKAGALFSNSGTIGGFTIGANVLEAGVGTAYIALSSTGSILVGDPTGLTSAIDPAQISIGNSVGILTWRVLDLGSSTVMEMWDSVGNSRFSVTANTGNVVAAGSVTAASFSGSGASLTSLNASNISSGTLSNSRLAFTPGSMASQNSTGVSISGGSISGLSSLGVSGDISLSGGLRFTSRSGNKLEFTWDGSNVRVYVDNALNGTIPNP